MKTKQPETSLESYHSLDPDSISAQHDKIVAALKVLKTGTAEQVGEYLGFDCWKRFSELKRDGRIVNTLSKRMNKSGRNAFVFTLPDEKVELQPTEKIIKGKGISDYSKAIQNIGSKQLSLL